jgi:3-dehydroquinate dehydratase-2
MEKAKKNKVLVIHGPNLHLLGKREPNVYGNVSLEDINRDLKLLAKKLGFVITITQSNSESQIIENITESNYDFLIINPAAYTHTSVAIRDALLAVKRPTIEVHLSNIYSREAFRQKSMISDVVRGVISGFGRSSYLLALYALSLACSDEKTK